MTTYDFAITPKFAQYNGLPTAVTAVVLGQTELAVYLYGRGAVPANGTCARCGRPLTHPGSIAIGIGPECLGNWGMRDVVLDAMTPEQVAGIRKRVAERTVDQWVPKSCVSRLGPAEAAVTVPASHPRLAPLGDRRARTARREGDLLRITFPFNNDDLARIKSLPGRRFNIESKTWTVPILPTTVEKLVEWEFTVDEGVLNKQAAAQAAVDAAVAGGAITGLRKQLFPFQQAGVAFVEAQGGRALIGDEMGLGKTVQALAWLQMHPELRPAVVVCPASLKLNWAREAEAWMADPQVQVINGGAPVPYTGGLIIINYDVLATHAAALAQRGIRALILDECHYIKNTKAKRTKATMALAKGIPHVIALSGTPAINRPVELYNALRLVNPAVVPTFWTFVHRYCGAKHTGFGWDFNGASNQEELHQLLTDTVMIRRLKADVLTDLPDKLYSYVPMELDNAVEYRRAEQLFIQWVRETKGADAAKRARRAEQLAQVEALKQLAVAGKVKQAISWIGDFIEAGNKLVVFAIHKEVIDALTTHFGPVAVKVDGSVSAAGRDEAVQAFQNDPGVMLFVGNIKAAGVGLTLTAASAVAFMELPWSPGELVQAEDRCHRIGQRNAVNVYYLVAQGTIDEQIAHLLDSKRSVLNAILDGQAPEGDGLLTSLIASYEEHTKQGEIQ